MNNPDVPDFTFRWKSAPDDQDPAVRVYLGGGDPDTYELIEMQDTAQQAIGPRALESVMQRWATDHGYVLERFQPGGDSFVPMSAVSVRLRPVAPGG